MAAQDLLKSPIQVPPLESGDLLSRDEFERRYIAMPHVKKAELIEGIVYMVSPLRFKSHSNPHGRIMGWLAWYEAATPGVLLGDNATVRLDADNEPQPDALLLIEKGGQSAITEDDYIEGAPELIVEVAASSASIDLHSKLEVYRRNQVQEYLVWQIYTNTFDWFRLRDGKYEQLSANPEGVVCSEVFPGLWLAKNALLSGDFATVLEVLQQGIATPEHQAFVAQLAEADN
jgi:Uma2 family endonuclease